MFAIGETTAFVNSSKLELPKEYHLKTKKIYAVWTDARHLYLSDDTAPLRSKVPSHPDRIFTPKITGECKMDIPADYNGHEAHITGMISTIEVAFKF